MKTHIIEESPLDLKLIIVYLFIALSFSLSITIVPLIGLGLNFTPWGVRFMPIIVALILLIKTNLTGGQDI